MWGRLGAAHVTFVPVDFIRDDAFEKLRTAGYDPTKKTLFLWEGVTFYLAEEDVRRTLRDIRKHAASGSVVISPTSGPIGWLRWARGPRAEDTGIDRRDVRLRIAV